jgi:haloalkane dehalogenase
MSMTQDKIAAQMTLQTKSVEVFGSNMSYVEMGSGDPIVFLHGIPTSNYIWRNIIPHLAPLGKCIAPDLIGFGHSDKPDISYSIFDHIAYFDQFINALNLHNITLVMHGWGSVIGLDYAMRNQNNCKGLVFYEAFLKPIDANDISLPYQEQLNNLTAHMHATDKSGLPYIDSILPQIIMRKLNSEELAHYRQPFLKEGTAKPILQYLTELPDGVKKSKIDALMATYSKKLCLSPLPKLMLYSLPGFITTIATAMWARDNLPNLELVDIGEELHLAQESCPELFGEAISIWLQAVEQTQA